MQARAHLSLPISKMRYDITLPLFEGRVELDGIDLVPTATSPMVFEDMPDVRQGNFGVLDFNMGYLLSAIHAGWEMVALPVFPKRKSVLQYFFVAADIKTPKDLEGRRVGTRQYGTGVAVWGRGFLKEHYGVDVKKLNWAVQVAEVFPNYGGTANIEMVDADRPLADMLMAGEIDAMITDISDGALFDRLESSAGVKRLFPNFRDEDLKMQRDSGIFPVMHLMVLSKKLDQDHPELAGKLYTAFEDAKALAYQDIRNDRGGLPLTHTRENFDAQMAEWGDVMANGI
ncbi:MAG: hypothetical protein HQ503_08465 [Rhodospirillales bacterium]|nr:hypothetical protein [Rhodospirillales bacterium]